MCKFKSGIVLRDEREKGGFKLLMSPWTESHSELCQIFKIKDGSRLTFARVEYSPDEVKNAHLVEKYKLTIDEERTPEWFDDEMKEKVAEKMSTYIKSIIVTGDVELLIGGQFIVTGDAKIGGIKIANVFTVSGSAKVDYIYGSANVDYISGSAKVGSISGSAKVGSISDSAKVENDKRNK